MEETSQSLPFETVSKFAMKTLRVEMEKPESVRVSEFKRTLEIV